MYFYLRRTTYLTCKCSKSESFSFDGESPQNTYVEWLIFFNLKFLTVIIFYFIKNLVLNSKECCPGGKTSGGGLSLGSVLLIM